MSTIKESKQKLKGYPLSCERITIVMAGTLLRLHTGYDVYIRFLKMATDEARVMLEEFTSERAIPEPLT